MAVIVPIVLHSTAMVAVIREREESFAQTTVTTVRVDTVSAREVIRGITELTVRVTRAVPTTAKVAISSAKVAIRAVLPTAKAVISAVKVVTNSVPTTVKAAISIAKAVTSHVPLATRSAPRATILMPSTA